MPSTVDHLFAGGSLVPTTLHQLTKPEDVMQGIPNDRFGSDHVPLITDLKWTKTNGYAK